MRARVRVVPLCLVAIVAFAAACTGDAVESPTPGEITIVDVILEPEAFLGEEVTVEGVVFEVIDERTFRIGSGDIAVGDAVREAERPESGTALVVADDPVEVTVDDRVELTATVREVDGVDPAEVFNDDELPEFALEDDPLLLASEVTVLGQIEDNPADEPEPTGEDT